MEQEKNHEKGFDMFSASDIPNQYQKIKIGAKVLEDAILNLGDFTSKRYLTGCRPGYSKHDVYLALFNRDLKKLRQISNFFYDVSGIYQRACNYLAFLYRYDWYVSPEIYDVNLDETKVLTQFAKTLNYLDNSNIKKICGDIAKNVIVNGCYYCYAVEQDTRISLQQLPYEYCRSRMTVNGMPVIEMNMAYFDTFSDITYRLKMIDMWPDEFKKGYILYKQGKLKTTEYETGWYMLTPGRAFKFNLNGSDMPMLVSAIPSIIDLNASQDLDRKKQMQQLLKILIQKLPLDKNGDLIFDLDEAKDIHNNAVQMLSKAIGVDVVTTFADVQEIDLSDAASANGTDNLERSERTVYNDMGISQNLFNTSGNLSLEKSILNDESNLRNLLLQFGEFYNQIICQRTNSKKYMFKFYMLETTQHNYKELARMYKEQVQNGYSKLLPQVALGHSQSFILNSIHFENEVLHLSSIMIPPLLSSTMSGSDILGKTDETITDKIQDQVEGDDTGAGRPELPEDQKSDKTLANEESMS